MYYFYIFFFYQFDRMTYFCAVELVQFSIKKIKKSSKINESMSDFDCESARMRFCQCLSKDKIMHRRDTSDYFWSSITDFEFLFNYTKRHSPYCFLFVWWRKTATAQAKILIRLTTICVGFFSQSIRHLSFKKNFGWQFDIFKEYYPNWNLKLATLLDHFPMLLS